MTPEVARQVDTVAELNCPLPEGEPMVLQPWDANTVVHITDSPYLTPRQVRAVAYGALLESVATETQPCLSVFHYD